MESKQAKPKPFPVFLIAAIALAVVAIGLFLFLGPSVTGFFGVPSEPPKNSGDPSQYLGRAQYFKEAFQPDRSNYGIFESASQYTQKPLAEMPSFFGLRSEDEIWAALPPIPKDFSEIAFLLAGGQFFAIGGLDETYYKQPEFYPNFKEGGLRWWKKPDSTSWATNGYGTYPAEQWTTLKRGGTEAFDATVFLYSGFGVQTYQGATLFLDSESQKYFDVTVSPQTFLLEPSFPKFGSDWAKKIAISGSLKPGTPPGDYTISVNVGLPPQDKIGQWQLKYRNLYQNAANGVRPSGNQIELHVTVE